MRFWGYWGLARTTLLCVIASSAIAVSAQTPDKQSRMKEIEDAILTRMNRQSDSWYEEGDFPKCIQDLRIMRQIWPTDYEIATNLGWMLENIREWDEALSVYVSYRTGNPTDPDGAWPEANFYFMKRAYAKIPPLLEPKLKSTATPHPNTFRTLAHAYDRLGLLKDSQRVWAALVKLAPDDLAAKTNLKRVTEKLNAGGTKS